MKRNKLLSLLLAFLMIFTLVPCITLGFAEEETSYQQIAIDTIVGIGLMTKDSDGNFLSETQVTRGELASIISNMFLTGNDALIEWKEKFFRELADEFTTADSFSSTIEVFSDVDNTSDYYEAIKTVNGLGIMTGYTDGSFGPENSLTYEQAYKVIVTMLGYRARAELYGGFPNGYTRMAKELNLLNGLSTATGNITRVDMATLIYNALDVKMLDIVAIGKNVEYSTENSEIFLKRFLGMQKITGRITDNGYSNLSGQQVSSHNFMVIGDVSVRMTESVEYARDYFGRTVNAYVSDNNGSYTLVYAGLDNLDTVVEIDAEDYVSYSGTGITYKVGDNRKTAKLNSNAYMIYNGSGKETYDNTTFKFDKGRITVVTPYRGLSADLVIVEAFESMYVDYVDYANDVVYSKSNKAGELLTASVDLNREEDYRLRILNQNGEAVTADEIVASSVISVAQGSNSMLVYMSQTKVANFEISEITTKNGDFIVSNDTESYIVSKKYIDEAGSSNIIPGSKYILYIDVFGDVVYILNADSASSAYTTAVVIAAAATSGLDSKTSIKVIKSDGVVDKYDFTKKVTVSDSNNVETQYTSSNSIFELLKDYKDIVRFKVDSNGCINYLEFPITQQTFGNPDNRLAKIPLSSERDMITDSSTGKILGWYYKPNQGFAGQLLVNNSTTKVFACPAPPNAADYDTTEEYDRAYAEYKNQLVDEDYYSVSAPNNNFSDDGRYIVSGYTTRADSHFAEYIVNTSSNKKTLSVANKTIAIFNESYKGVDADGSACEYISCYVSGKEVKIPVSEDCIGIETMQNPGVDSGLKLEKGDIFRYILDANGKAEKLQIIVNENEANPCGGQGNLAQTLGAWSTDSAYYSKGLTNPYAANNKTGGGYTFAGNGNWWSNAGNYDMRNALYWAVYTRNGSELCLTTQPLGVSNYEPDVNAENYVTDYFNASTAYFVTINENGVTVKTDSCANIKTYEITHNDCDRVFVMSRVGSVNNIVVYTNYSK